MSRGSTEPAPLASATDGKTPRSYARKFRVSVRQLLFGLVLFFVARPFLEGSAIGQISETLIFTFVLVSSLMAVGGGRLELLISLFLIVPAVTYRWLAYILSLNSNGALSMVLYGLAIAFTIWQMLRFIVRSTHVDSDVLCAGISAYLLLGLLWAFGYSLVDGISPGSFLFPALPGHPIRLTSDDSFYISMSALTTANFGDIVPKTPVARLLSTLESTTGVLYLAVLMSRLVSMHLQRDAKPGDSTDGNSGA
jgi:hypothetical protein